MSAIAGIVCNDGRFASDETCRMMTAAACQRGESEWKFGTALPAAFAHRLSKSLPEDDFDCQPLRGRGARYLLVADVRIDNRAELAAALGFDSREGERAADSTLLLAAWEKWGEPCLDRILGDYAFALWDAVDASLILARAPMSLKPFYYSVRSGLAAFASDPAALQALQSVGKSVDCAFAASLAAGIHPQDGSTIHAGITEVRRGHVVRHKNGAESRRRFWRIREDSIRCRDFRDYGLGLRAELDRAVAAQLRSRGAAGSHLSSGRDSGAVMATAAMQLAPRALPAFTGAPRTGYGEYDPGGKIADESRLAAKAAGMHPNVRHIVCRRNDEPLFGLLGQAHLLQQQPLPNVTNLPWWWSINARAEALGVTVMLGGTAGNFTISALGERHVVDLLRSGRIGEWWRVARGLKRQGYVGWPFLLRSSFGPWLPPSLDAMMMRALGRAHAFQKDATLLTPAWRDAVRAGFGEQLTDVRPPRSHYEFRRKMLYDWSFSDRFSLRRFGVEFRDPTADRRLIDYCLSLPIDALASPHASRPTYDTAFEDRVPPAVRSLLTRGYQGADWHEMTGRAELLGLVDHYWQSPTVAEILDRSAVRALAERWPAAAPRDEKAARPFRDRLMNAMVLANFIAVTFDGLRPLPGQAK